MTHENVCSPFRVVNATNGLVRDRRVEIESGFEIDTMRLPTVTRLQAPQRFQQRLSGRPR
jgi:hypothetical protein